MGGASLAMEFASSEASGYFNGLVVGATMGATISFNIPFSMGVVSKEKHEPLLLGISETLVNLGVPRMIYLDTVGKSHMPDTFPDLQG